MPAAEQEKAFLAQTRISFVAPLGFFCVRASLFWKVIQKVQVFWKVMDLQKALKFEEHFPSSSTSRWAQVMPVPSLHYLWSVLLPSHFSLCEPSNSSKLALYLAETSSHIFQCCQLTVLLPKGVFMHPWVQNMYCKDVFTGGFLIWLEWEQKELFSLFYISISSSSVSLATNSLLHVTI